MSKRKVQHKVIPRKAGEEGHWPFRRVISLFIPLFLMAAVLVAFWQVRHCAFVSFDDNEYIVNNPHVKQGLTFEGVRWAFTATHANNWHPLTWVSHMVDYEFYGLRPGAHHLTNLLFHIVNAVLLFLVLKRMTGALWESGFVAALFALHPLHVESVAWVSERKDVLSAFFWMMTMGAYVRYTERPGLNRYLVVLLAFALGLLSKPMLVTLPLVLLLLDYWPLGRFVMGQSKGPLNLRIEKSMSRLILEKVPFFLLSAVSSFITFYAQQKGGTVKSLELFPLGVRVANGVVSYVSYIGKMIWPHPLAVLYPHPGLLPIWEVLGAGILLAGITVLVIRERRRRPYLVVGWLWYVGTLVPVIGLVQVGMQALADRYTYVPLIGLFMMVARGVPELLKGWRYQKVVLAFSGGLLLLICMVVTRAQVGYWKNSLTLFEHALRVTSNNYLIHNGLGLALAEQGKFPEAIVQFAESLRIRPDYSEVHYNLGLALSYQRKIGEAVAQYIEALRLKPAYAEAHFNLGFALAQQGKPEEAMTHYVQALRIKPAYAEAHNQLGIIMAQQGRRKEAMARFAEAIRIKSDYAEAYGNLGNALAEEGKIGEAIASYTRALQIKADYAEGHYNMGVALAQQGKIEEAIAHYGKAIQIKPDHADAYYNLGAALAHQGKIQDAIAYFAQALRIKPDFAEARFSLALAYVMVGNRGSALEEYKILRNINPDLANTLSQKIFR